MIKYTIVCPNCGETKTFEKERPSSYERKFCSQSCGTKHQMSDPKARQRQSKVAKKLWEDPKFCANNRAERIKYTIVCPNCDETKTFEKHGPNDYEKKFCNRSCANSYTNKEQWANPVFREKMDKIHKSLEYKQKQSTNITKLWEDPIYRNKLEGEKIEYTIICPNCDKECTFERTPGNVVKKFCCQNCANSYTSKKRWEDPEFRQSAIISMIEKWAEPEHRQKMIDAANSPERIEKLRAVLGPYWADSEANSQKMKALWTTPEYQ